MKRTATISECGRFRYSLTRQWNEPNLLIDEPANWLVFIGLNPSIADAEIDDPTIRRCIGFAKREGYGGMVMLNLSPLRSTDPSGLFTADIPIEVIRTNWEVMRCTTTEHAPGIVAAWGSHPEAVRLGRIAMLEHIHGRPDCLGVTKDGHPRHPLYVRGTQELIPYRLPMRQAS